MTERYDYLEHVTADVIAAICDSYTPAEIRERIDEDRERFAQDLNDDLWTDDSVTGNSSGSYYCTPWQAEEALAHNWDMIGDMIAEYGEPDIFRQGPEHIDTAIRCYLLYQAIDAALDQLDEMTPAVYCTVYTDIGIMSRQDEHITLEDARDRAYLYARQGYTAEIRDDSTGDTLDTYPAHTDPNTYYVHSRI